MIIAAVVVVFSLMRLFLIPESFGKYGHYRGDNREEQMNLPIVHQGSDYCKDCHQDKYKDWQGSGHRGVNCEVCHGHWEIHNGNLKTMPAVKNNDTCLLCHQELTGRPENVPQIKSFALHLAEQEVAEGDVLTCVECHDPHAPI